MAKVIPQNMFIVGKRRKIWIKYVALLSFCDYFGLFFPSFVIERGWKGELSGVNNNFYFSLTSLVLCFVHFPAFLLLAPAADDYGREICQQHLGPSEERHPGDPEEEQQWTELRGAVQERLHHGAPQARGEALHGPAGGGDGASHQQSKATAHQSSTDFHRDVLQSRNRNTLFFFFSCLQFKRDLHTCEACSCWFRWHMINQV